MSLCNTYTIFLHSTALNSDLWRRHCDGLTIKVIISRQEATSQVRDRQLWDWRCSQRCCWRDAVLLGRVGRAVPDVSSYPGIMESSDWYFFFFWRKKRFWVTFAWSEAGWCRGLRLLPQLFLKYFLLEGGTKWHQAHASRCDYSRSALFSPLFLPNKVASGTRESLWLQQISAVQSSFFMNKVASGTRESLYCH